MKEMWILAFEELVEEYLEDHPSATEKQAEDFACEQASDRVGDNFADIGDQARKESRENPNNVTVSSDRFRVTGFNPKEEK